MFAAITGIDLFDQNAYHKMDTGISLALIYLNKIWAWHIPKLESDVDGYYWY